ncbi:hypothetical protein JFT91_22350 [Pseudomonas sp. TH08]|uniref:hypothetical protein n=1 Tax=Pseudomonas sp. TH08 TaxID=2796374 RepID=UPI001911D7BF|nr:hypothetical protein [Pseudomonas sp. TH08]MBK5535293.1 hypothetical protein [Pseudomonas sp. TH08]
MRIQPISLVAAALAAVTLSGCVTAPTWTNRGPSTIVTAKGMISCYEDANIIDGERMQGTICATPESGFFGGGEPEIYFGPWNRKFMKEPASTTTAGVTRDYQGKTVFLQCDPVLAPGTKTETGRACKVTVNGQLLVTANVEFKNRTFRAAHPCNAEQLPRISIERSAQPRMINLSDTAPQHHQLAQAHLG